MPPVAASEKSQWEKAMQAALSANQSDKKKPSTWYALQNALEAQPGSGQTAESWKTTIRRIRSTNEITERVAVLIAQALQVDRSALPTASGPVTKRELERRLLEVEAVLNAFAPRIEAIDQRLDDLSRRLPPNTGQVQKDGE